MKKLIILLFSVVLIAPVFAQAEDVTNFEVGTCKKIGDELYQQLSDGTWAAPDDELNTCQDNFNPRSWLNLPQFNPWQRYGDGSYQAYWENDYPDSTGDWFLKCMVMQTFLPQPECQGLYGYGNWGNLGYNNPLDYPRNGRRTLDFWFGDDDYKVNASVSFKTNKTIDSILYGLGMGWFLNQLTS